MCVSGENQKSKKKKASVLHLTIIIIYFVFHINQIGYRYYCMLFMKSVCVCVCVCVQCEWPKKIKTRQVVLKKKIWSSHFESSSQVVVCVCEGWRFTKPVRSLIDLRNKQQYTLLCDIIIQKKNFYVFYVYNKCISKWQDPINLLNFISTLFVSKKMSFIH